MVMVEQSFLLCTVFAVLTGLFLVLATVVVSYPERQAKITGKEWSKRSKGIAIGANFIFFSLSAVTGILASWFGPVSILLPTMMGAQLVFNMLIYCVLLGLEKLNKDILVGTLVIVASVVLLPIVGPGFQDDQDALELLQSPGAIAWNSLLIAGMAGSILYLSWLSRKDKLPTPSEHDWIFLVALLIAQTTTGVMDGSLSKLFVLTQGALLYSIIAFWLIVNLLMNYTFIIQAITVKQSHFVPACSSAKILVNALTGIFVWQDYKVITSWAGYVTVFFLLALGNYLLSEHNIFAVGDGAAGAMSTAGRVGSTVARRVSTYYYRDQSSQCNRRSSQHLGRDRQGSLVQINSQWLIDLHDLDRKMSFTEEVKSIDEHGSNNDNGSDIEFDA